MNSSFFFQYLAEQVLCEYLLRKEKEKAGRKEGWTLINCSQATVRDSRALAREFFLRVERISLKRHRPLPVLSFYVYPF